MNQWYSTLLAVMRSETNSLGVLEKAFKLDSGLWAEGESIGAPGMSFILT